MSDKSDNSDNSGNSDNLESGNIYILFNEMYNYYNDENDDNSCIIVKIGKTSNCKTRFNAYITTYIEPCKIKFLSDNVKNYTLAEKLVFKKLDKYRIKQNKEFFKIHNLKQVTEIIKNVIDTVNNLSDIEINDILELLKAKHKEKIKPVYSHLDNLNEYMNNDINHSIKMQLLKQLEKLNNIKPFDLESIKGEEFNLPDDLHCNISISFRKIKDKKPKNMYKFKQYYVGLLKHLFGDLNIIETTKSANKDRNYVYSIDDKRLHNAIKQITKNSIETHLKECLNSKLSFE